MQWTEYCQNLSAAVFHAPRQMSRAIKARELAPKFSAVVVVRRNKRAWAHVCATRVLFVTVLLDIDAYHILYPSVSFFLAGYNFLHACSLMHK